MQRKWRRSWEQKKASYSIGSSVIKAAAKCVLPPLVVAGILLSTAGPAFALPTNTVIVNGTATITQTNDTMDVNQGSRKLIVNSDTFVINSNETLNLNQGLQDVALWKVTSGDPSAIYGNVNASGGLFLINEGGTLFSKGSQVNVGSLVTSSLNIADSDFLAGNYKFTGSDNSGAVVNQGTITAKNGGYIALMGPQVRNEGILVARQGTVALGAGKAVTLDMHGDGLLNLAVDAAAVNASAVNHQLIAADGGRVIMTGRAAKDLVGTVVNNSGIIQARSIENKNGVIRLDGGAHGTVANSGTLDASGKEAGQKGGTVKVLGENVELANGTSIDVSGAQGGGTALIGGNYQGKGPEQNAKNTTVENNVSITADALDSGNGGKVIVWADDTTKFNGQISARGGANSGNGGLIETSGHKTLELGDAAWVVTLAPKGKTGNWLLDPEDFTIGTDTTGANYWNHIALGNALNSSDITVQTATTGSGNGDINVDARVDWSSPTTLTLSAHRNVNVYADIASSGGADVKLRADNTGTGSGSVRFTDGAATGHVFTDGAVAIYYNPAGGYKGSDKTTWSGGTVTGPYGAYVKQGDGASPASKLSSYMLVNNATDLQNLSQQLAGVYALGRDIDASVTRTWTDGMGGRGFTPIGPQAFTGSLDGDGHTIDNLYINYSRTYDSGARSVGLFGMLGEGSVVRNLSLTNVDITGTNLAATSRPQSQASRGRKANSFNVGGLAGLAESALIDNVYVSGQVTGVNANAVGGLVGMVYEGRRGSQDSILNSASEAAVTARGFNDGGSPGGHSEEVEILPGNAPDGVAAGGLIGQLVYNSELNTIDKPGGYNGGVEVVTSTDTSFVRNSYSSGPVTVVNTGVDGVQHSTIYAGGLVGLNQGGSIDQAYSTGAVTVTSVDPKSTVHAGGLVGASTDSLNTWDMGDYVAPMILARYNGETISNSYSTGKVSYGGDQTHVGGFVGSNSGAITGSYWDTQRSGQSRGIGANTGKNTGLTGLTTAQMVAHKSNFAGWDFDSTWFMLEGYTTPFLRSEYSTNIRNAHQLQLMALNPAAHYTLVTDLDLRGYHMAPGVGFAPINNFSGRFNGQRHTINYLNIHDYATGALGLFGTALSSAKIHDVALANASITGGTGNAAVGILAGDNAGSIYNVFTGGTVSGDGSVGGIAGKNSGSIATSFSAAKVSGAGSLGGLVGNNSGAVEESYVDEAGSVNGSGGSAPVTGANSGTVTAPTYDLGNGNWVSFGANNPVLAWTVTPDGRITLYTATQLQALQNHLSGRYRLGGDLDLAGLAWNPIGTAAGAFTGALDGNHYTLNNLTLANNGAGALGLFGYTQGAALSNLTLMNVNIAGGAAGQYVGGLAGYADGGSIVNSAVSGIVTATGAGSYVGGLAGYNSGSIADSGSTATVTAGGANSQAGGLAGANAGDIAMAYNTGAVTVEGEDSQAGGLAGENAGSIAMAYNTGAVTAAGAGSSAGGVAGVNSGTIGSYDGLVYNTGAVTTKGDGSYAGGVAGQNTATGIIGVDTWDPATGTAYNTGAVTAAGAGSRVGGVAGDNAGTISQAYAAAVVTARGASSYAGGVAGYNSGNIWSAFFGPADSGLVAKVRSDGANSSVGGIAGYNSGAIADTLSLAAVSSSGAGSKVGGLVGANAAGGSLDTSYTLGAVTGTADSSVGGLIGRNDGTVANAVWNPDSAFASTDPRYLKKQGVGSGTDAGTALTYSQMLQGSADYWSGWSDFTNWFTWQDGLFPGLYWSPTYSLYGRVQAGGPGVTVNKYDYDWVSRNILPYTTETIGADGLFLMPAGGTEYNSSQNEGNPARTVLFTVAGQPYKANSIYAVGLAGSTAFYDLKKDTLLFSIPDLTDQDIRNRYRKFDFKKIFDDQIASGAVAAALADKYPDLLFSLGPVYHVPGDWHDPGGVHDQIFLYDLDVAGSFEAQSFDWYIVGGSRKTYVSAGSVTAHQTAYAAGDIIIDNSQWPADAYSYAGNRIINGYTQLISAGGKTAKFIADGDITLTENQNIAIGSGSGPRIIAGGDVTINCGGMFINWAGPDAIQAGGRYLIYAPDMLLTSWLAPAPEDPSAGKYQWLSGVLSDLFFGTRYNDLTYKTAMRLTYLNDQLIYDTRGGLNGFVQWGYQAGDSLPAGSGFVYTAANPRTAAGIAERPWLTPAYFAAQDRRQWAAATAQADSAARPGLAADSAIPDVRDDILQVGIVDGGVALPADTDDTDQGEE